MKAVVLDVPDAWLEERRRLGVDRWDELWEGVLHMVPPPSGDHQILGTRLAVALSAPAEARGLLLSYETGLFASDDDYRVPDLIVASPLQRSDRGVEGTAELVIELRSPGDETDAKLPWYAARRVTEVLVVDPATRRCELHAASGGSLVAMPSDADGTLVLTTVGARLCTVVTTEGPRVRVEAGGAITDC